MHSSFVQLFFFWDCCFQEAEISASISSGASRSLDTAQKKGTTILNLKCVDAQVICYFEN